jgi:hypothetical protein
MDDPDQTSGSPWRLVERDIWGASEFDPGILYRVSGFFLSLHVGLPRTGEKNA